MMTIDPDSHRRSGRDQGGARPREHARCSTARSCAAPSVDSFVKLNPRHMLKNPVMFVVEVGSVLTTILFFTDLGSSSADENVFAALVAAFLWFTVLFANFAEAVAEGRGKAQADTLRRTRSETMANRRRADGSIEEVPGHAARPRRRGRRRRRRGHPERRRRRRRDRQHRRVGDHR